MKSFWVMEGLIRRRKSRENGSLENKNLNDQGVLNENAQNDLSGTFNQAANFLWTENVTRDEK